MAVPKILTSFIDVFDDDEIRQTGVCVQSMKVHDCIETISAAHPKFNRDMVNQQYLKIYRLLLVNQYLISNMVDW